MKFLRKIFGPNKATTPAAVPPARDAEADPDITSSTGLPTENAEVDPEQLLALLEPVKRTAYIPVTEEVERTHSAHSKMGGYPYLSLEHSWPVCPNCGQHMQLFLQLNLQDLPERKEDGLVQLFYCTNDEPCCEIDCGAYDHFAKSVVCRRLAIGSKQSVIVNPLLSEVFPEKKIVGWSPVDDYPSYDELEELGIDIDIDAYEVLYDTEKGLPVSGDKLFGWPYWVQNVEYPYDRETGSRMELLFQIDSEVNLPYMFGDVGVGHLTVSKDDPNELAFGWACH